MQHGRPKQQQVITGSNKDFNDIDIDFSSRKRRDNSHSKQIDEQLRHCDSAFKVSAMEVMLAAMFRDSGYDPTESGTDSVQKRCQDCSLRLDTDNLLIDDPFKRLSVLPESL